MANVADKARFHLERAVPQLREFEEKEIFSKEEIRSLVSKRTAHEHLVLGPGCTPSHFTAYVAWEQSLDALRAKRCLRKKIKHSTSHAAQARIFNIYERAVFRHPGSRELWLAYLDFAARAKASKRWRKIVTRALRLHPTDAALWKLAAGRAVREGDMEGARGLYMRGCRFCNGTEELWVDYARAEMEWLAKMERKAHNKSGGAGKRKVEKGGNEGSLAAHAVQEGDVMLFAEDSDSDDEGNMILPEDPLDAEQTGKAEKEARQALEEANLRKLATSPALEGAIPKAILIAARGQPFWSPRAGEAFFDMLASFTGVAAQRSIVQHLIDAMVADFPRHPTTGSCLVRQPMMGADIATVEFARALREVLGRLRVQTEATEDKRALGAKTVAWIEPLLADETLDESLRTVLEHTRRRLKDS